MLVITESGRAALTAKANVMQSVVDIASMDARSHVCVYAFSTLASLACDDVETKRKVARAGSVRAVCAAMQAQANDPRLQANACRVLANLSAEPSLVTSIVTAGGIRLVCSAMSAHDLDARVQEEACAVLSNAAFSDEEHRAHVVACSGCELVCHALRSHSQDNGLVREAASALANITKNAAAASEAAKMRVLSHIGEAMARCMKDEKMQIACIVALDNITLASKRDGDEGGEGSPGAKAVATGGGQADWGGGLAGHVVDAMRANPVSLGIAEYGCLILANIALEGRKSREAASTSGAPEVICDAMRQFSDEVTVQKPACAAMANLMSEEKVMAAVLNADGVKLLMAAMTAFPKEAQLQEECCFAIGNLACGDATVRMSVGKAGGPALVANAMKRHQSVPGVQVAGCQALANLCWGEVQKRLVNSAGGPSRAIEAMREHADSAEVAEWGCKAVNNMACNNEELTRLLIELGALQQVCTSLKQHVRSKPVQREGCVCLGTLMSLGTEMATVIKELNAREILIATLAEHKEEPDVQRWGHSALRTYERITGTSG